MTLADLKDGEKALISKVRGRGAFRRRIIEMGFVVGKEVTVIRNAPLRDPVEYSILGYHVSIRRSEASLIEVIKADKKAPNKNASDENQTNGSTYEGVLIEETHNKLLEKGKVINIALVGNPNCGKTTFFNFASGSREKVGNYSGVTVDAKEAVVKMHGYKFNITDLPGTYSISAYTPEELFVRSFIAEQMPDVVVNVVDSSNLERNLYLTTQLIDMDIKVVMVLNMFDELQQKGDSFDYDAFGSLLGIPAVPAVSSKGQGIKDVFRKIIEVFEDRDPIQRHIHINYGPVVEKAIKIIQEKLNISENYQLTNKISSRFLSLKMLEGDKEARSKTAGIAVNWSDIEEAAQKATEMIQKHYSENPETVITDLKYGFIAGALKETFTAGKTEQRKNSEIIDAFLTHKLFGFPVFLFFMWVMFTATFKLGSYPMEWLETGVEYLSSLLNNNMAAGSFKDLLINGIISGVGGVLVFLPNIVLLFFFISLMEDSGYMSRAVFIMDKLMHKIGLHGKSFIPLIMGFGCNVPAIMATRTLENRNDRMLTMLINPFMSCSARLPIYVLMISAFFPNNQGTILFLIYAGGVGVAILSALILKKFLFKTKEVPFVMELPPYRVPTWRSIIVHMWDKAVHYLKKISGIILIASIIIWALGFFPGGFSLSKEYEQKSEILSKKYSEEISSLTHDKEHSIELLNQELEENLYRLEMEKTQKQQEVSYIGLLGKTIEPVMRPLGFDWKMSVAIISGVAAKEIVVSTLGVLYHSDQPIQTQNSSLVQKLQSQTFHEGEKIGQPVFSPLIALSFMVFVLLYFPCIGVIATISKESGHWKWGMFTIVYTTAIAWFASFLVFQIGSLLGF